MERSIIRINPEFLVSKRASSFTIMDGNEAAVFIAYKTLEVYAINPITPS